MRQKLFLPIILIGMILVNCASFQDTVKKKGKPDILIINNYSNSWYIKIFYGNQAEVYLSDYNLSRISHQYDTDLAHSHSYIYEDQMITTRPGEVIQKISFLKKLYAKNPVLRGSNPKLDQIMSCDDLSIIISQAGLPLLIEESDNFYPKPEVDGIKLGRIIRLTYLDTYYDMYMSIDGSYSKLMHYDSNQNSEGKPVVSKPQPLLEWFYERYPKLKKRKFKSEKKSLNKLESFAKKTGAILLLSKSNWDEIQKKENEHRSKLSANELALIRSETQQLMMANFASFMPAKSPLLGQYAKYMGYYNTMLKAQKNVDRAVFMYQTYQKLLNDPSSVIKAEYLLQKATPETLEKGYKAYKKVKK